MTEGPFSVVLGARCIVHESARLEALKGPIVLGDANVLEESVRIRNESNSELRIGCYNRFEVGSCVQGSVGDCNVFKARCRVE